MGARGVLGGAISKIAGNRNLELRLRKTAISAYTGYAQRKDTPKCIFSEKTHFGVSLAIFEKQNKHTTQTTTPQKTRHWVFCF